MTNSGSSQGQSSWLNVFQKLRLLGFLTLFPAIGLFTLSHIALGFGGDWKTLLAEDWRLALLAPPVTISMGVNFVAVAVISLGISYLPTSRMSLVLAVVNRWIIRFSMVFKFLFVCVCLGYSAYEWGTCKTCDDYGREDREYGWCFCGSSFLYTATFSVIFSILFAASWYHLHAIREYIDTWSGAIVTPPGNLSRALLLIFIVFQILVSSSLCVVYVLSYGSCSDFCEAPECNAQCATNFLMLVVILPICVIGLLGSFYLKHLFKVPTGAHILLINNSGSDENYRSDTRFRVGDDDDDEEADATELASTHHS